MSDSGRIHQTCAASWDPSLWRDVRTLVAVSGGADSVALLRCLHAVALNRQHLHVAHFNHRWRGGASDADEAFVVELSSQLGLPLHVGRAESVPDAGARSEDDARVCRLAFLEATASTLGARYVVTAHTADDQAETIVHRILRGTGIAGLAGIQHARPLNRLTTLVRPFLQVHRADVLQYLEEIGQTYREDTSNDDRRYTRARIRHELLPHLQQDYNPHVTRAVRRLGSLASEAQAIMERLVDELVGHAVVSKTAGELIVDCAALDNVEPYLVREMFATLLRRQSWPLQAMTYDKWVMLATLAVDTEVTTARQHLPQGIQVVRDGQRMILSKELAG